MSDEKIKYKVTDGVTEIEGERPAFKVLHGASLALAYLCEKGYGAGEIQVESYSIFSHSFKFAEQIQHDPGFGECLASILTRVYG